jgi:ABC-type branched-subunit amino acid transport system substrate-binding protein
MKVFIHYHNTLKSDSLTRDIMTEFAWNNHADMIIGPLYSEMAAKMAPMAEQYQIPLLAPLANSDSLNFDNPYVFQANPTYTVRGKKMADFAVNRLHLDTLGVIVDKNSFGMNEAFAFRDEAERLGAKIRYFFSADFEKQGFNVSEYTKYFTSDSTMIDSLHIKPVDAVYLPMTGSTAQTLIKLIFTDFEAYRSNITILGSQEWSVSGLEPESIKNFNIYYSGINIPDQGRTEVRDFEAQYNNRFGISATRFSIIGYNCAKYLLDTLKKVQNPALLKEALKENHNFKGISSHFFFNGTHINQAVEFYHLTPQGSVNVGIAN